MVDQRSIGTIKLDTKEIVDVKFEVGVTQTKTILRGADIRRNFALKPLGERAVENALLHEIIAKIPDTTNAQLTIKKSTRTRARPAHPSPLRISGVTRVDHPYQGSFDRLGRSGFLSVSR